MEDVKEYHIHHREFCLIAFTCDFFFFYWPNPDVILVVVICYLILLGPSDYIMHA